MTKIVFCNKDITDVRYSGFTITKIFACGGELVYEYQRPTPTNPIARVYVDDKWVEINDDDSNSAVTSGEVNTWLTASEKSSFTVLGLYDNCKEVGDYAFYEIDNMTSINSWGVIQRIGKHSFDSCAGLTSLYIPCHISLIDKYAFYSCIGLTSVTVCNSANDVTIGTSAFASCTKLSELNLGEKVKTIGISAFQGCKIGELTIPTSVTSIGDSAFKNNTSMTKIVMQSTTPPTIGTGTFDNTNNCPIVVPNGYKAAYRNSWSAYASRIKYDYEI